ncbi:MAG: hypothetical protein QOE90_505 [Thermoplasmata archaeon]|jgi:hypothetical protein|nr:hypothetical protein [Thermoplasmata archaeon]
MRVAWLALLLVVGCTAPRPDTPLPTPTPAVPPLVDLAWSPPTALRAGACAQVPIALTSRAAAWDNLTLSATSQPPVSVALDDANVTMPPEGTAARNATVCAAPDAAHVLADVSLAYRGELAEPTPAPRAASVCVLTDQNGDPTCSPPR